MASPGDKQADSRKDPPKADTPRKPTDDELSIKALKNRIHDLNQRFLLKERLQLGFIFDNLPRAYYLSWKIDGNECFSLMVNLKRRLKELEAKKTRR